METWRDLYVVRSLLEFLSFKISTFEFRGSTEMPRGTRSAVKESHVEPQAIHGEGYTTAHHQVSLR